MVSSKYSFTQVRKIILVYLINMDLLKPYIYELLVYLLSSLWQPDTGVPTWAMIVATVSTR